MERAKPRSKLGQTRFAKERCATFKKYMTEAARVAYLTYEEATPEYKNYVEAIYYKIILRNRVANMTSWFCSSCFSFTIGTKKKHLDFGHPEADTKSCSFIYAEMKHQECSKQLAEYLQKATRLVPARGLEVKTYSLPSINRRHDRDERICCRELERQLQELREEVQSLSNQNERLRNKVRNLRSQRDLANTFAAMRNWGPEGLQDRWDKLD
jgi:hypothetical protein